MRVFLSVLTGAFLLLTGCDDSPTEPTTDDLAGSYVATTLTVDDGDATVDALAEGAALNITLASNGTTTGTFLVPASMSDTGQLTQHDLQGTWTLDGSNVTFDHEADTFLKEATLQVMDGALEAVDTSGETVHVVLERS